MSMDGVGLFNLEHDAYYVGKDWSITRFMVVFRSGLDQETVIGELVSCVISSLKWLYSKQPKLGLTQEFVVDCAHALWVVHPTKGLVTLMLLKGFLSDNFIYFMYIMLKENF